MLKFIARRVGRNLLIVLLGATAFVVARGLLPTPMTYADQPAPPSQSRAEILVERYDCWIGEAPHNVDMPGHVVWQHPDGRTVYSARLVGPALNTIFAEGNLSGRAIAFCR